MRIKFDFELDFKLCLDNADVLLQCSMGHLKYKNTEPSIQRSFLGPRTLIFMSL